MLLDILFLVEPFHFFPCCYHSIFLICVLWLVFFCAIQFVFVSKIRWFFSSHVLHVANRNVHMPGASVDKVVLSIERRFGLVRMFMIAIIKWAWYEMSETLLLTSTLERSFAALLHRPLCLCTFPWVRVTLSKVISTIFSSAAFRFHLGLSLFFLDSSGSFRLMLYTLVKALWTLSRWTFWWRDNLC